MRMLFTAVLLAACASTLPAAKDLEIFAIDVEGGQATLLVSPSGQSLLIDTGWPGMNHRDAGRIAAAAKAAGVKKIDYLLITHYHDDHVGGVQGLARRMPILNFVDHGPQTETGKDAEILFNEYKAFRDKGNHIVAKPGDTIPIKGLDVQVLSSAGSVIAKPLVGAGAPTAECSGYPRPAEDRSENGQSVGVLITFGSFRMLDMGDLTSDREYDLVCPNDKIGTIDLFLVSHHGMNLSNSLPFVRAISPRVALIDNGPSKGGDPKVWQTLRDTRGLLDIWQLHYAVTSDKEHNPPDAFIANVDTICEAKWIKVTAEKTGTFRVINTRDQFQKTYVKK